MTTTFISCPVCKDSQLKNLFVIDYDQGRSSTLYRCDICNYHFIDPIPSDNFLSEFYGHDYCSHQAELESWRISALQERVNRVEKYARKGKLLDVGCGNGNFCLVAQNRGWEVVGIEPFESALKHANEKIKTKLQVGTLQEQSFEKNSFDAITFWAVIEHLHNPLETLEEVSSLLKKGGVLVLQLPHIESLAAHKYKSQWRLLRHSPDHLGFLTKKTVKHLSSVLSFNFIGERIGGYPYPAGKGKSFERIVPTENRSITLDEASPSNIATKALQKPFVANLIRNMINLTRIGDDIEFYLRKE